jgi:uncharacterized protein YjbJ (UPF0337 family)
MGSTFDKAKGNIKEAAGDLTDDNDLRTEGKIDQASGTVKEKAEHAKDKVEDFAESAKNKVKDLLD